MLEQDRHEDSSPGHRSDLSVVVLTCDRPDDLIASLDSMLQQDLLPGELVLVDDGRLDTLRVRRRLESAGIRFVYHLKDRRGIARSRNIGLRLASGNLVMFLDDDQLMRPGYIRGIVKVFDGDSKGEILGAGGEFAEGPVVMPGFLDPLWNLVERLFLLRAPGHRVLRSGFSSPEWQGYERPTEVPFLSGCATYRKSVSQRHQFDETLETLSPYSFGEDLAFSFQVGREGKLILTPEAAIEHHRSPSSRPTTREVARLRLYNQYYLYSTYFRPQPARPLAFAWAVAGRGVLAILRLAVHPGRDSWAYLCGTLSGTWLLLRLALTGGFRPLQVRGEKP